MSVRGRAWTLGRRRDAVGRRWIALVAVFLGIGLGHASLAGQGLRVAAGATTLGGDAYTSTQMGTALTLGLLGGEATGVGLDATLAEIPVMSSEEKLISGAVDVLVELRVRPELYLDVRTGVERQVHEGESGRTRFDGWRAGGGLGYRKRLGSGPLGVEAQVLGLYFSALSGSIAGVEQAGVYRSGVRIAGRLGFTLGG